MKQTPKITNEVDTFLTGAKRNSDENKPDYEGYLSPLVIHAFGEYMTKHQFMSDGTKRASDNWQLGIPKDRLARSLFRHIIDFWTLHRGYQAINPDSGQFFTKEELLCAIIFNAQAFLHGILKSQYSYPQIITKNIDDPIMYDMVGGNDE